MRSFQIKVAPGSTLDVPARRGPDTKGGEDYVAAESGVAWPQPRNAEVSQPPPEVGRSKKGPFPGSCTVLLTP